MMLWKMSRLVSLFLYFVGIVACLFSGHIMWSFISKPRFPVNHPSLRKIQSAIDDSHPHGGQRQLDSSLRVTAWFQRDRCLINSINITYCTATQKLLNFSLSWPYPVKFLFLSTVSASAQNPFEYDSEMPDPLANGFNYDDLGGYGCFDFTKTSSSLFQAVKDGCRASGESCKQARSRNENFETRFRLSSYSISMQK